MRMQMSFWEEIREQEESPAYKMISRILKLPPKKQKVVIQTMSALIDGIEGIR